MRLFVKTTAFLLFLILLSKTSYAERIASFKEAFRPKYLSIDKDYLYIVDVEDSHVHIYRKKDYQHVARFGRKGQGPGDFEYITNFRAFREHLFITSTRKISYYSKNGELLRELTTPINSLGYLPIRDGFICSTFSQDIASEKSIKRHIVLMNSKFGMIREVAATGIHENLIYNKKTNKMDVQFIRECHDYHVENDKIFVANTEKGFSISVFDAKGMFLHEIVKPYVKIEISNNEMERMLADFRDAIGEVEYHKRKKRYHYTFPKHYPAFSGFTIDDGKIYVFLFPIKMGKQTIRVLDLNGEDIGTVAVPSDVIDPSVSVFCVSGGSYYYLKYCEDSHE